MTTPLSSGPDNVSRTSPPSWGEASSASTLLSLPATTATSPVSSTLPASSPSSSLPVASLLTSALVKTTDVLEPILVTTSLSSVTPTLQGPSTSSPVDTSTTVSWTSVLTSALAKTKDIFNASLEPVASSPPTWSNTSDEILAISEATTYTETIYPSVNTVVANVETISSPYQSYSTVTADSGSSEATSTITSSTMGDTTVSTTMPRSSVTTGIETEAMSSLSPGLRETSTSQETSSFSKTSTILSNVPADATAGVSRTDVIFSSRPSIPDRAHSTTSPDIFTGTITGLSTLPAITESEERTITSQTGSTGATLQGTLTLDTSTTTSWAGTHSIVTQGFPHSEMTTLTSSGPENESWTSPPSVEDTSSASSLLSLPTITSPSPVLSTLLEDSPSSALPVTSLLTTGLAKTTDIYIDCNLQDRNSLSYDSGIYSLRGDHSYEQWP
ncbi:PREDICTED: mucin-16-like [Galeopterus variegatus]|uniref:Mucin-16-like n=1 Tax=Galeopterus variegatus TaxID=482537 RepID=A0ABM0Q5A5_GALVR|nr:PREDICTED: mucin-16-like [Galeopterus variegatus]